MNIYKNANKYFIFWIYSDKICTDKAVMYISKLSYIK